MTRNDRDEIYIERSKRNINQKDYITGKEIIVKTKYVIIGIVVEQLGIEIIITRETCALSCALAQLGSPVFFCLQNLVSF